MQYINHYDNFNYNALHYITLHNIAMVNIFDVLPTNRQYLEIRNTNGKLWGWYAEHAPITLIECSYDGEDGAEM